ncbi:3-methyladenine DNA glycosylase [Colwellia sp. MT41]|uniref:DNA-3-methyladenine glycosylase I n=1 Tax=Colwellia sp. MT41 TaxID=58049 RepID=UPI0007175DCE|nr:DNA-3-methyladenine glycosylase I [Colwellia sp. MT41]ALO36431.1 3-methyladenine DNA glycosylase [Colwellia sp. MT41]
MTHESFKSLFKRAAERKGGVPALKTLLGKKILGKKLLDDTAAQQSIAELSDDRILAAFTKQIFKSGFVWRVVEKKWPDFEEHFFNFNLEKIMMMPEEMWERKAADPKIIRNFNKVKTIQANAQMMFDHHIDTNTSFAQFINDWPSTDIIGLWAYLKKHGQRLGGNTGPYALRLLGKDTFILSSDVEAYLRAQEIIDGGLQSKKSLTAIQAHFNKLQSESGYSLTQLSRLIAFSCGDNYVQIDI